MYFVYFLFRVQQSKKSWIIVGVSILLLVSLLALGFGLSASNNEEDAVLSGLQNEDNLGAFTNSENHESVLGNYSTAAVASDGAGPVCATIGKLE